jgi:serine O-acetyltransferase
MLALKADTHRLFGRTSWQLTLKGLLVNSAFGPLATLRLCQATQQFAPPWRWLAWVPARILHELTCLRAGIELPWRTQVEPGLTLTHGHGMVVNVNTRIGRNVTLFHGVTLGQRDAIDKDGNRQTYYPVIEDDVWIGPHAIVVGARIGKGSRIAGGAYVYQDVPPYCVVLGNPGKIVKTECTPDVVNRFDSFDSFDG